MPLKLVIWLSILKRTIILCIFFQEYNLHIFGSGFWFHSTKIIYSFKKTIKKQMNWLRGSKNSSHLLIVFSTTSGKEEKLNLKVNVNHQHISCVWSAKADLHPLNKLSSNPLLLYMNSTVFCLFTN